MGRASSSARQLGRSLVVVRPSPGTAGRALRATASVAAGLLLVALLFNPTVASLGLTGAMAAGVAREAPLRRRLVTMTVVGAITVLHAWLGLAIGNHVWLLPPVMTVLTVLGVWGWQALRTGPPGPINMLFAIVYGQHLGSMGYPTRTVLAVLGTAWAGAVVAWLLMFLPDVHRPVREAVDEADDSVSSYRDHPDDEDAQHELRATAQREVEHAWWVFSDAGLPVLPAGSSMSELRERLMGITVNLVTLLRADGIPASPPDVAENLDGLPLGSPPRRYLLRSAAARGSRPWLVALRAGLAVLMASSLIVASPIGRPYWAVLTALVVLHMGASRSELTLRATHRTVGTALGVFLYLGIVQLHPGPWAGLAVVVVSVFLMNLFIARNYALGVVFVTAYALLMLPVASGVDMVVLMRERVVETVIGSAASLFAIWFVGRRAPVLLVRGQYRRTLRSIERVLGDQAAGETLTPDALDDRRILLFELERAGEMLSLQRNDDPALSRWNSVQDAVSRFGYDVLARSWRRIDDEEHSAAVANRSLHRLIGSLPPISVHEINQDELVRGVRGIHADYLANVGTVAT